MNTTQSVRRSRIKSGASPRSSSEVSPRNANVVPVASRNPDASAAADIAATRAKSASFSASSAVCFSCFSQDKDAGARVSFPAGFATLSEASSREESAFFSLLLLKENLLRGASASAAAARSCFSRSVVDAHARASYGGRKYEASAVLASIPSTSARSSSRTPFESVGGFAAAPCFARSASSRLSTASRSVSNRARNDRTFSRGSAASLASARRASRSARREASMPRSRSCRAGREGGRGRARRASVSAMREKVPSGGVVDAREIGGDGAGGALEGDRDQDAPSSARASPPHPRRRHPPRQPPRGPSRRSVCDASWTETSSRQCQAAKRSRLGSAETFLSLEKKLRRPWFARRGGRARRRERALDRERWERSGVRTAG